MTQLANQANRTTLSDRDVLSILAPVHSSAVSLSGGELFGDEFNSVPHSPEADVQSTIGSLFGPLVDLGDGWDGYGALAPRSDCLTAAARFVEALFDHHPVQPRLPLPDAMATVAGGVLLEWESSAVDLLLDFEPGGKVIVSVRLGDAEDEEGDFADLRESTLEALIRLAHSS